MVRQSSGEQLRLEAIESHEVLHAGFLERCRLVAYGIWVARGKVSTDDVRRYCEPPVLTDASVFGAVFRDPPWKVVGRVTSRRPEAKARKINVYARREG